MYVRTEAVCGRWTDKQQTMDGIMSDRSGDGGIRKKIMYQRPSYNRRMEGRYFFFVGVGSFGLLHVYVHRGVRSVPELLFLLRLGLILRLLNLPGSLA